MLEALKGMGLSCPNERDPDKAFKPVIRSNIGTNWIHCQHFLSLMQDSLDPLFHSQWSSTDPSVWDVKVLLETKHRQASYKLLNLDNWLKKVQFKGAEFRYH